MFFFTKDVLSTSLATKWDGRDMLDQDTIEGIRCKCINYWQLLHENALWFGPITSKQKPLLILLPQRRLRHAYQSVCLSVCLCVCVCVCVCYCWMWLHLTWHDCILVWLYPTVHINYLYPDLNDKNRWIGILKKINNKCCNTKNRNKSRPWQSIFMFLGLLILMMYLAVLITNDNEKLKRAQSTCVHTDSGMWNI